MIKKILIAFWLFAFMGMAQVNSVFAGTDLSVNCSAIGSCGITPGATPLYNEAGWVPGSTVTQRLSITNSSSQNGFTAVQMVNYSDTNNLGQVIDIQIHQGSPTGPTVYSANSLITFRNDGYFTLSPSAPGQTIDYYFIATMLPSAGNQYQGSMVKFDLNVGLELTPIAPPSGGNSGGGGNNFSAPGPASAPTCTDTAPSSAPTVTITNVGNNTVTLQWTPVSPVSHYGIFFTRTADGAQYGAPDIGNVTTYTITNLGGGANYSFQVFGVNGCAPGPRSGTVGTQQTIPGGAVVGRPLGNGGQVLGVATGQGNTATISAALTASPTPAILGAGQGQVEGASTATCSSWKQYIPWILLVIQFILIMFFEYRYRHDSGWNKHILALLVTGLSIFLFYLLRECSCTSWSWLSWLCKWYWLVALLLTIILKAFSYAFLDESTEREEKPKSGEPKSGGSSTTGSGSTGGSSSVAKGSSHSKPAEKLSQAQSKFDEAERAYPSYTALMADEPANDEPNMPPFPPEPPTPYDT